MSSNTQSLLFVALAGLWLGSWWSGPVEGGRSGWAPAAHAAETSLVRGARCRTFRQPMDAGTLLDTTDATSEVGRWVAQQKGDGWVVGTVDFEVTQKQTGFPMGLVAVCLTPAE